MRTKSGARGQGRRKKQNEIQRRNWAEQGRKKDWKLSGDKFGGGLRRIKTGIKGFLVEMKGIWDGEPESAWAPPLHYGNPNSLFVVHALVRREKITDP